MKNLAVAIAVGAGAIVSQEGKRVFDEFISEKDLPSSLHGKEVDDEWLNRT